MANPILPDDVFVQEFLALGGEGMARKYGISSRSVFARRRVLEKHYGKLSSPVGPGGMPVKTEQDKRPHRLQWEIRNGTCLIGSDFHIWPGARSTAQRAFIKFADDVRPAGVIINGDLMDFPQISRHPQGWEATPTPAQEIEAAQDYLSDLQKATKRGLKAWPLGNHDYRMESYIAQNAAMLRGLKGIHLHDHVNPMWTKCIGVMVNHGLPGATMVKHRFRSGIHAPRTNTANAGISIVTGHLHSQKVMPMTDYQGDRYGVDTGCCADPAHRQFLYAEDNPLDWRSGFALLTWRDGRLMQPELISVWDDDHVQFRGQLIKV